MNLSSLRRWIAPLRRRVQGMIGRCVLRAVDDSGGMQTVDVAVLAQTIRSGLERMQEYGFTSRPFAGAEGVVVYPHGDQDHGIVIATDDRRYRIGLAEGEVALYDDQGQFVKLRRAGGIDLVANGLVTIGAPNTLITGDLQVDGKATVQDELQAGEVSSVAAGTNMAAMKNAYNAHTHPGGGPPDLQM